MSEPMVTGYPPVGAWFYPWPASRGEVHLHRVRGYRVDAVERELEVDADCGVSFVAGVAVQVPDRGRGDLLCGRCCYVGRDTHRTRPGRAGRPPRMIGKAGPGRLDPQVDR